MITAVNSYKQNNNVTFGFAKLSHKKIVSECFDQKHSSADKFIKKPVQKGTALWSIKQMFFEVFPKLDPDYKKFFGHLGKKV